MTIIVTITECYGDRKTVELRTSAVNIHEAVARAIKKGYGGRAVFMRDNGLSVGGNALAGSQYGQIGHKSKLGGISLDTGRVCIRAERA